MKKIAIGCDHGGFDLKEAIRTYLEENGYEYKDFGSYKGEPCDYPAIGIAVGECVASKECDLGILVCGTGLGISMAASKVKGIRAACCSDYYSAKYTRLHNDANILALGGRVLASGLALEIVEVFLTTECEGGRHQRRIDMISDYEEKHMK